MNSLRTLFFLLLLAVPMMATAQSAPAAARPSGSPPPAAEPVLPAWDQLSPEQRDALVAPLRERWNDSPQERARNVYNFVALFLKDGALAFDWNDELLARTVWPERPAEAASAA